MAKKVSETKTIRHYVNLEAQGEFDMFVKPRDKKDSKELVFYIYKLVFRTTKNRIDEHLADITTKVAACNTFNELEKVPYRAMTAAMAESILSAVEACARKFSLNLVEQGYILRECITAIDSQMENTVRQIVKVKMQQISKAPTIVGADGKTL